MSKLAIDDLSFSEAAMSEKDGIKGSGVQPPNLTRSISTALSTAVATKAFADFGIRGDAINGFRLNAITYGGAAAAAAGALSLGGKATAFTLTGNYFR